MNHSPRNKPYNKKSSFYQDLLKDRLENPTPLTKHLNLEDCYFRADNTLRDPIIGKMPQIESANWFK